MTSQVRTQGFDPTSGATLGRRWTGPTGVVVPGGGQVVEPGGRARLDDRGHQGPHARQVRGRVDGPPLLAQVAPRVDVGQPEAAGVSVQVGGDVFAVGRIGGLGLGNPQRSSRHHLYVEPLGERAREDVAGVVGAVAGVVGQDRADDARVGQRTVTGESDHRGSRERVERHQEPSEHIVLGASHHRHANRGRHVGHGVVGGPVAGGHHDPRIGEAAQTAELEAEHGLAVEVGQDLAGESGGTGAGLHHHQRWSADGGSRHGNSAASASTTRSCWASVRSGNSGSEISPA